MNFAQRIIFGMSLGFALGMIGSGREIMPTGGIVALVGLVLAFVVATVIPALRGPRILPPAAVEHAREQVAMRKALYDLLAPAKYGRTNFMPDTSDRYRRAELRTFLREILDGRGDE